MRKVEEGIDNKALAAAINLLNLDIEADYGSYPKGLIYGLNMFATWLYDDSKPFETIGFGKL